VLVGASSIAQLEQNLGCLSNRNFSADDLGAIEAILRS
jgi:aryl-alcohol dehydrogenase-like predicted oxidoreductase